MKTIYYERSDHQHGDAEIVWGSGRYRIIKFEYANFHANEAFACQRQNWFWVWRTLTHWFSGYVGGSPVIGARPGTCPSHYQSFDDAQERIAAETAVQPC